MGTVNQLLSIAQAAKLKNKKYHHIHRLVRKKRLKATKVGWAWMIERTDLDAYYAEESKKKKRHA